LQLDDLVDVLTRLGLTTLGAFAALDPSDVVARFGAIGVRAHGWANGIDDRPASPEDPQPELEVAWDLDPPLLRVDQAAFVAKGIAEEFIRKLGARGISCARVAIIAETEHGETQLRLWRSEEAFSAAAISDRMRWQLDGWLSGPERLRPTGGLSRLVLRPDDISVAAGRQLGFWGEQTGLAERAARSIARVQGIVGVGVVQVPEVRGGRSPGDQVVTIAAESVDLVERATSVNAGGSGEPDPGAGVHAQNVEGAAQAWVGGLPAPAPTKVHQPPVAVEVLDAHRQPVRVGARGLIAATPAWIVAAAQTPIAIVGWSGPWLLDEYWWRAERRRREARMQLELADGGIDEDAIERWFVQRGVPQAIFHYNAAEDVLTRMVPYLTAVFLLGALAGFGDNFAGWSQLWVAIGAFAILTGMAVALNRIRGRSNFDLPDDVGWVEIGLFLVGAPLVAAIFGDLPWQPVWLLGLNLVMLGVGYLVTFYGAVPMLKWGLREVSVQVRGLVNVLSRLLPLMLLFATFLFLNAEMWQVAHGLSPQLFAIVILMVLAPAAIFLALRSPAEIAALHSFSSWKEIDDMCDRTDAPISRQGETPFFMVFGLFTVREETLLQWTEISAGSFDPWLRFSVLGSEVVVTWELFAVSGFIAAISALQFAVSLNTDEMYRKQFYESLESEIREVLAVRARYLEPLVHQALSVDST